MTALSKEELKHFLNEKVYEYNRPSFIELDPISIPYLFSKKQDIEISGFLAATIAWGQRKTIINNAKKLVEWMDMAPYDFIVNSNSNDIKKFSKFVHRTFNGDDCMYFILRLKQLYQKSNSLESYFYHTDGVKNGISQFKDYFFKSSHLKRTEKHVSNPAKGSSAKRLNMYLRWMVRQDNAGVDFGIWQKFKPSHLFIPLDVHTGNVGRKLGLTNRKQNDWQTVEEITNALKKLDPVDPVKYDFALFGLGIFENF